MTDQNSSSSNGDASILSYSYFFDQKLPIDRWIGLSAIFFFLSMFYVLNEILLHVTRHRKNWNNYWRWRNLLVSWTHALVCGTWDLVVFFISYNMLSEDMIQFQSMAAYLLVAFSTGYFLFDLYDMWIYRKAGELWELVAHHISISIMFVYHMMANQCIGYNVVALLAEVNSFFLHSRKLMQMAGLNFKNSRLYTLNAFVNIVTFFICRFGSMIRIAYAIATEYNRVTTVYLTCISSCMIVLWAINPVLLYRLVRADIKMWRGKLKDDPANSYVVAAPYNPAEVNGKNGSAPVANGNLRNGNLHHKHNGVAAAINGNGNGTASVNRRHVQEGRA